MNSVYIAKIDAKNNAIDIGFEKIITPHVSKEIKTVLIKPNFINASCSSTGTTTDISLIAKLVCFLKKKGIKKIIVAEAGFSNTEGIFKALKVHRLENLGAKVLNLEKEKRIKVIPPFKLAFNSFEIPEVFEKNDLIISFAKMKTHSITGVTLSIKNFYGILNRNHRNIGHIMGISKSIFDIYSYLVSKKKVLAIIDGIVAMEGRHGPTDGKPKKMDLVIIGDDAFATDYICTQIMYCPLKKAEHLELVKKYRLGSTEGINLLGENIAAVKEKFELPPLTFSFLNKMPAIINRLLRKKPYLKSQEQCIKCGNCTENCPKKAITITENGPCFDYSKCTSCLICCEACIKNIISYHIPFPQSIIYNLLKKAHNDYFKKN